MGVCVRVVVLFSGYFSVGNFACGFGKGRGVGCDFGFCGVYLLVGEGVRMKVVLVFEIFWCEFFLIRYEQSQKWPEASVS